jgi:hypothetical protein
MGVAICDLCVYWEDTPVMDQVAALALAVASGEEDEVLKTANFFNHRGHADAKKLLAQYTPGPAITVDDIRTSLPHFWRDKRERELMPFVRRRAEQVFYKSLPLDIRHVLKITPFCEIYEREAT